MCLYAFYIYMKCLALLINIFIKNGGNCTENKHNWELIPHKTTGIH